MRQEVHNAFDTTHHRRFRCRCGFLGLCEAEKFDRATNVAAPIHVRTRREKGCSASIVEAEEEVDNDHCIRDTAISGY